MTNDRIQSYFGLALTITVSTLSISSGLSAQEGRWWATQTAPKSVVRTIEQSKFPSVDRAYDMLVQSVAGLAAKAVNEGRSDQLVWVATTNIEIEQWYALMIKEHPEWETHTEFEPWALVDHFFRKNVIKGYILYSADKSERPNFEYAKDMNSSVNVATSLAGALNGVLIEERLQAQAETYGLKQLADAREMSQSECFERYKDQFSRQMLCTQDPKKANVRDLAIAHNAMTVYGDDAVVAKAMSWLEPLSPILGWNGGDEFETTKLSSIHGHFQTATDWCMNLPVLMAGSEHATPPKVPHLAPQEIDWNDTRSVVSFVMSDGDNIQWSETSFFLSNQSYWNSPDRGQIPFGWSCCFSHLTQLAPTITDFAITTRTRNDDFIEWGGGYYYPDLFGEATPNRWELLAKHAAKTWALMRRNDTRIVGFNVWHPESADARKSYEVFAGQTEDLLAIFVFQYAPYEGGAGKTYWVKDRNGVEIPVITARYSIWEHSNNRPRSGTPAKVAREIVESVSASDTEPRYDWAVVHAWSYFRPIKDTDDDGENMPQADAESKGGIRGYTPVTWCVQRLPKNIAVVGPEELVWRLRMKHDPETTKRLFGEIK
ncbi:GxGYxYP domain-containing protein [Schlesneria paludicola]|uniref:GxGYxYP domain-containing protein n=1 Tax=Schlesneria paludicola TaxID=360056 RepID=UPI00029A7677|nr:GxGYxYP domain-containing protein [Schlesneria paludicola]